MKCSATLVLEEEAAGTGGNEESILVSCLSSCTAPCGLTTMRETQVLCTSLSFVLSLASTKATVTGKREANICVVKRGTNF